ncbi:hypothetical protein HPB52_007320 [Rhipicephalus sanguineus]|uniref:Uncharacterized protein n=1 Tax=Rhipicephalus sanguineus TaxID=34632 RepID=A0A9D4SY65_RHISA|nr:hypothetical protein HPB52_007320 [Rhipicephalus sanguineus]
MDGLGSSGAFTEILTEMVQYFRESSPTSSDESDGEKESACSSAPPTSAGTSSTFAAKSRRPKEIIKRLQGRVCKYKKTIERLRKRQLDKFKS